MLYAVCKVGRFHIKRRLLLPVVVDSAQNVTNSGCQMAGGDTQVSAVDIGENWDDDILDTSAADMSPFGNCL